MFMTFKFCNELEILLPNTSGHFGFQFASAICTEPETPYCIWTESGQGHWLVNLHTMLNDLILVGKIRKTEKPQIITN